MVDTIRFIKTNKAFYNLVIAIWLKFRLVCYQKIELQIKNRQNKDAIVSEFTRFLTSSL